MWVKWRGERYTYRNPNLLMLDILLNFDYNDSLDFWEWKTPIRNSMQKQFLALNCTCFYNAFINGFIRWDIVGRGWHKFNSSMLVM